MHVLYRLCMVEALLNASLQIRKHWQIKQLCDKNALTMNIDTCITVLSKTSNH